MVRIRNLYVLSAFVVLAILVAGRCSSAHALTTHGTVEPLAAGVELETARYFPLDLGRTWTYRDSMGSRYRHLIAGAADLVDKVGRPAQWLRRREIYELPNGDGAARLIERWLFEIDPERGIVSIGGEDPTSGTGPIDTPGELELPRKLTAAAWWIAYKIRYDFRGLADVDVGGRVVQGVFGGRRRRRAQAPERRARGYAVVPVPRRRAGRAARDGAGGVAGGVGDGGGESGALAGRDPMTGTIRTPSASALVVGLFGSDG